MSVKKEYYTDMFQWAMLVLNGIAVAFLCTFIYVTTNRIRANYDARDFLGNVLTIPDNPKTNLWLCLVLFCLLVVNFFSGISYRCETAGGARLLSLLSF